MKRKPRPPNLLDQILKNTAKLHSSLSAKSDSRDEAFEVASGYMMPKMASQPPAGPSRGMGHREVCRNTECGRSDFETDARRGDRICMHCGAVQNARSLESQEEEHRTFADDDGKSAERKRAEVQRGKMRSNVGDASLKNAQQAASASDGGNSDMKGQPRKRLEKYQEKVQAIAEEMRLTDFRQILDDSRDLCEKYVRSQIKHDEVCPHERAKRANEGRGNWIYPMGEPDLEAHKQKAVRWLICACCEEKYPKTDERRRLQTGGCRLSLKPKHAVLVAASCILLALRKAGQNRTFDELAGYVTGTDQVAFREDTGKVFQLVRDHLAKFQARSGRGLPYACEHNQEVVTEIEDIGEEEAAGAAVGKHYAGLLPRMIEDFDVPYFVLTRANEWLEAWQNVSGIGSNRPEPIVACAILCAHDELRSHPRFKNYSLSEITAEHLRKAPSCGVTADTIVKTKEKLPSAPPATSLLWPQATQQAKPSSIPTPAPLA